LTGVKSVRWSRIRRRVKGSSRGYQTSRRFGGGVISPQRVTACRWSTSWPSPGQTFEQVLHQTRSTAETRRSCREPANGWFQKETAKSWLILFLLGFFRGSDDLPNPPHLHISRARWGARCARFSSPRKTAHSSMFTVVVCRWPQSRAVSSAPPKWPKPSLPSQLRPKRPSPRGRPRPYCAKRSPKCRRFRLIFTVNPQKPAISGTYKSVFKKAER